ncbi:hypothetical protein GWK41_06140 [Persephonella atlantica]|uniref:Uncharacterized protein n=1 Tax=Persephonella atlantica TaxID=2699429 RepID=A0ABS1GI88_9AQUI|nr:hypothetical protein [Persephonella atlantica]MBK3332642.1 hypothetical protein [Persephonella atlantica]
MSSDFHSFKEGNFLVIRVIDFYKKSGFVLTSRIKNASQNKSRPIIITEVTDEKIRFVATTKSPKQHAPKINVEKCVIEKVPEECFGLPLNRKYSWLFVKKTQKTKRWRVYYTVDVYTLKQMFAEGTLKKCGNCPQSVIFEIEIKINDMGEVV